MSLRCVAKGDRPVMKPPYNGIEQPQPPLTFKIKTILINIDIFHSINLIILVSNFRIEIMILILSIIQLISIKLL